MNNSKLIIIILGVLISFSSCMKPQEPTEVQILTGEWEVINVVADGQVNFPEDTFLESSMLHLDRNETFLFINVDGRAEAGDWEADGEKLTLKAKDVTKVYNIVYLDYDKLHVNYTFSNQITGEIELVYLFKRVN